MEKDEYSGSDTFVANALQRQFRLYIPFLGIARPQPQLPHSCVFERFIYSQDQSTYFLQQNRPTHRGNIQFAHRHINLEIGTEAPIFLFWEYLFQIFGFSLQCGRRGRWNQIYFSLGVNEHSCYHSTYTVHRKKRFTSFPSPAGMSLTKLPLGRNNSVMTLLFPPRESLVVRSRLGTGNSRTFFLRCTPDPNGHLVLAVYRHPAQALKNHHQNRIKDLQGGPRKNIEPMAD